MRSSRIHWRSSLAGAGLCLALAAPWAWAQPAPANPAAARAQIERCGAAAQGLAGPKGREVNLSLTSAMPHVRDVLTSHGLSARLTDQGRAARIELHLGNLRDVEMPSDDGLATYRTDVDAARVQQDPRSRMPQLWRVDEATVHAAELAYNVRYPPADDPSAPGTLDLADGTTVPEGYEVAGLYTGFYSGFAAIVLESKPARGVPRHRIYAIAGTHVFDHTDLRTWASGLTFGAAQITADASLRMLRDAAAFAADRQNGGEVFVTGQSQGGLTSQGFGYLLQTYLEATAPGRHHLVQVVSWGGVGAEEALAQLIQRQREGEGRGYWRKLETHFSALDPTYRVAAETWNAIAGQWASVAPGQEAAHIALMASRMRVVGYFFEIDMFARAGTFIGTTFAFPTALILPENCDELVAEAVVGSTGGTFGVRLESHFLRGYHRAVRRGAVGLARPAFPHKWQWATDLLPTFDKVGRLWMETIYLNGPATAPRNWNACLAAGHWVTRQNQTCSAAHWPGCGPVEQGEPNWCLITEAGVQPGVPVLR